MFNPRYIVNFPTKRHWRGKIRYEDIENGLEALVREVRQRKIRSIAIPPFSLQIVYEHLMGLVFAENENLRCFTHFPTPAP